MISRESHSPPKKTVWRAGFASVCTDQTPAWFVWAAYCGQSLEEMSSRSLDPLCNRQATSHVLISIWVTVPGMKARRLTARAVG